MLDDPGAAIQEVEELPGVHVTRSLTWRRGVEFETTFEPMVAQRREGYKDERARVLIPWDGEPLAWPRGPRRRWKHRNPTLQDTGDESHNTGSLCLWYPRDPRPLRWDWEDGLAAYYDRLHRHLLMEENWRRTARWAAEDAPHGHPAGQAAAARWPVVSEEMKEVVRQWETSRSG